ncbi:hypothetical protein L596_016682 [Steinernema carpocapsae]|nr:hypothetical protein L596_016682 [Steinernema carpocapsae]
MLILSRLAQENSHTKPFEHFFDSYRTVCQQLTQLRDSDARRRKASGISGGASVDLDSDLAHQYEDLKSTHEEMLKKKEVNDQRLITAKYDLEKAEKEKTKISSERDVALKRVEESEAVRRELVAENLRVRQAEERTQQAMQELKDEHLALQLLYNSCSENLKKCTQERDELVERLKELKMKQIEFYNQQTEAEEARLQKHKMEQIEAAMKNMNDKNFELLDDDGSDGPYFTGDILPTALHHKIEFHEGEVTDLTWLKHGETFFSASADHSILQCDVSGSVPTKRAKFAGSTQGVMRVDVNPEQTLVLGACHDKVLRIWSLADQRCRHEFLGHSDKVTTAKFFTNGVEVASGSADRTVKLWDMRQRRCVKTCMVGSTVFDLVTSEKCGAPIISGHYDKKIRLLDPRQDHSEVAVIPMENKITSLALGSEGFDLLCATRDETLSLIDMRTYQVCHVYSAEQYRSTSDYSKCCISPGMTYIAAGSVDGSVFIWNLRTTKLEKMLTKGHGNSAVLSLAWHPRGNMLISGDKKKTVCLWR